MYFFVVVQVYTRPGHLYANPSVLSLNHTAHKRCNPGKERQQDQQPKALQLVLDYL